MNQTPCITELLTEPDKLLIGTRCTVSFNWTIQGTGDVDALVHGLASFVQQKSKIGGHSNPFGGSSITYVGSVCHQSRVIWSWGAHSALTS